MARNFLLALAVAAATSEALFLRQDGNGSNEEGTTLTNNVNSSVASSTGRRTGSRGQQTLTPAAESPAAENSDDAGTDQNKIVEVDEVAVKPAKSAGVRVAMWAINGGTGHAALTKTKFGLKILKILNVDEEGKAAFMKFADVTEKDDLNIKGKKQELLKKRKEFLRQQKKSKAASVESPATEAEAPASGEEATGLTPGQTRKVYDNVPEEVEEAAKEFVEEEGNSEDAKLTAAAVAQAVVGDVARDLEPEQQKEVFEAITATMKKEDN